MTDTVGIGDSAQQQDPISGDSNTNPQNGLPEKQPNQNPNPEDNQPSRGDPVTQTSYGNGYTWNFGGSHVDNVSMDDPELTLKQKRAIADTYTKASLFGPKGIVMNFVHEGGYCIFQCIHLVQAS